MNSNNYWVLRPSPHEKNRIKEFKMHNFVAIGWPLLGDLRGKTPSEVRARLEKEYPKNNYALSKFYYAIDCFVNEMKIGDILLIPDKDEICYAKIDGDYYFDEAVQGDDLGYPHQRKIIWLNKEGKRSDLPVDLRKSLKQPTIININKYGDYVDRLARGEKILPESGEESNDINVDYPLRANYTVSLTVPKDMTQGEAERLAAFVKTLHSFS